MEIALNSVRLVLFSAMKSYHCHNSCFQFYVGGDGFRVLSGDLLGVSSENAGENLIGFDEDSTHQSLFRLRQLINGSTVFADLPRVSDVVDDFSHDSASTRFSVAVQIAVESSTTTSKAVTGSDMRNGVTLEHNLSGEV